jgi:hypothetical protein
MYWRAIRDSDLPHCLELQIACLGDEIVGRAAALRVWNALPHHPAFHGTVIESEVPIAGQRLMGCGMGVFVTEGFASAELNQPRPGLNSRIIHSLAEGSPVVLDRAAIGAGNAGKGVDFVNLYGTWREGALDPPQLAEVQALLGVSFVEHISGYRFHRVLKECVGASRIALARATGTYRIVAEFPESESALAVVTPQSGLAAPYPVAAAMYRYRPPVLRLRSTEQDLLAAALDGGTDAELSTVLGLSIESTKKRWLGVFARVDQFKPEILGRLEPEGEGRGPQKRHRVLAYVRAHPEELRPFSWRSGKHAVAGRRARPDLL